MFLFNTSFPNVKPLWPAQDTLVILGGVFLVRFAYTFLTVDRSKEARWMTSLFAVIAALTLGWMMIDTGRFFLQPKTFRIADEFWLVANPILLLGSLFLSIWRRCWELLLYFGFWIGDFGLLVLAQMTTIRNPKSAIQNYQSSPSSRTNSSGVVVPRTRTRCSWKRSSPWWVAP